MFDKILAFLEVVFNIIRSIMSSLVLILLAIGLLTILFGSILNVGGIIVIGVFLVGLSVVVYLLRR